MAEKKILVVDDEPTFVRLVSKTLTHKGYEVLMAGVMVRKLYGSCLPTGQT